jgi:hypothetical protein
MEPKVNGFVTEKKTTVLCHRPSLARSDVGLWPKQTPELSAENDANDPKPNSR